MCVCVCVCITLLTDILFFNFYILINPFLFILFCVIAGKVLNYKCDFYLRFLGFALFAFSVSSFSSRTVCLYVRNSITSTCVSE